MADNKWLLQRGEPSRLAAILVHVTVIRATTGMPRPFNDFYPLANVPYVRTCEISLVCMYLCKDVWVCIPRLQRGTVIISSPSESPLVQPLLNSPSTIILESEFRGWNPSQFSVIRWRKCDFAAFTTWWIIHSRSIQWSSSIRFQFSLIGLSVLRCKFHTAGIILNKTCGH